MWSQWFTGAPVVVTFVAPQLCTLADQINNIQNVILHLTEREGRNDTDCYLALWFQQHSNSGIDQHTAAAGVKALKTADTDCSELCSGLKDVVVWSCNFSSPPLAKTQRSWEKLHWTPRAPWHTAVFGYNEAVAVLPWKPWWNLEPIGSSSGVYSLYPPTKRWLNAPRLARGPGDDPVLVRWPFTWEWFTQGNVIVNYHATEWEHWILPGYGNETAVVTGESKVFH